MTTTAVPPRPDLAPLLVSRGFLTSEQVEEARKRGGEGSRFAEVAIGLGIITEDQIHFAVSAETGLPFLHLSPDMVDRDLVARFSAGALVKHGVVPLLEDASELSAALVDPWDSGALDVLTRATSKAINISIAARGNVAEVLRAVLGRQSAEVEATAVAIEDTTGIALVYQQLLSGSAEGAEEIHFDATPEGLLVRFRLHGRLSPRAALPAPMALAVFTRLKVLASVDPFEQGPYRRAGIRSQLGGKEFDLTFAHVPSSSGGSAVVTLSPARPARPLAELLGDEKMAARLVADLGRPGALVGLGAPSGLPEGRELAEAVMAASVAAGRKVVTLGTAAPAGVLEVEGDLASALSLAPDVLHLAGDAALPVAIEAAMSGVPVALELGYRRAADVLTHILTRGNSAAAAACARSAVALRQVRLLCPQCRAAVDPAGDDAEAALLELDDATASSAATSGWFHAPGCDACRQTGFSGKGVLAERLAISQKARAALREGRLGEALALCRREGPEGAWLAEGRIGLEEVD